MNDCSIPPNRNFVQDCFLSDYNQESQLPVKLYQLNTSNYLDSSDDNLTALPSLEKSFLHSTKIVNYEEEVNVMQRTTSCGSEKLDFEDNFQENNAAVTSEDQNSFNPNHTETKTNICNQPLQAPKFNHHVHEHELFVYNQACISNPNLSHNNKRGNFCPSTAFFPNNQPSFVPLVSKSSLSSLESLASSITASPILDPDFFSLSKERKASARSSKHGKSVKSALSKRRRSKISCLDDDDDDVIDKGSVFLKNKDLLCKTDLKVTEENQFLEPGNDQRKQISSANSRNRVDSSFSKQWLPRIQPSVPSFHVTESQENQPRLPKNVAVYAKLNKAPSTKGKLINYSMKPLIERLVVTYWTKIDFP